MSLYNPNVSLPIEPLDNPMHSFTTASTVKQAHLAAQYARNLHYLSAAHRQGQCRCKK